jgi:oligoendopeptidase F
MIFLRCSLCGVAAAVLGAAPGLRAQVSPPTSFDPFPGGSAARYHFDLTRNFFSSPADELARREKLLSRLGHLAQISRSLPRTASGILAALAFEDSLDLEVNRHVAYLELRFNADTRQREALRSASQLRDTADRGLAAFDSALAALPSATLARHEGQRLRLRRYRFAIERGRRDPAHRLTPEGERVYRALAPMATGWGGEIFSQTMSSTNFGAVQTSAGPLSVSRDFLALMADPDPRVRREAYLRNEAGLEQRREVYATILTRTAAALTSAGRLRGYPDFVAQSYSERYLDRRQVQRMLDALGAAAEVNKRIEQAMSAHQREVFHLDTIHVWDQWLLEPGVPLPRFTIADASRLVLQATRPLGPDYARELALLLDPANGRLDVAPGPFRASRQGFSVGLVGFPSMFYQGAFGGYLEDVVTLAHESGHAVQNMLMTANGVLPRYASGPAYFTESFAGLSELLLLEHLYRTAADKPHRLFYLQRLITQAAEVFRTGWEAALEQQLFDSAAAGRSVGADGIEAMTQATASRFSTWFGPGSERKLAWLQPTQYFTRPLYRLNYLYAKLLALRYLDLLHRDAPGFPARYGALLRNGYDAPPDVLLGRFVDINLSDPELIENASRVLDAFLEELNALYAP